MAVLISSCSSNNEEVGSSNSSSNENSTDNSTLSEFECEACIDFVNFKQNEPSFLNFLISKGYDLNNDAKISCKEALLITELNFGNSGFVKNLKGIEQFKNLKRITGFFKLEDCYNCDPILNLYNNKNLEEINLNETKSTIVNGLNVGERGWVKKLILPNSFSLKLLNSPGTEVESIYNLSTQSNLELINLNNSNLKEEIDLSGCNKLISINLSYNYITSIKFSNIENPYLTTLKMGATSINYNHNSLTKIALNTFPNLEELDLSYNQLGSIDISKNTKIKNLHLDNNKLLKLDVSNNNLIKSISASNNMISILNINNLINLNSLYFKNNSLDNLDLSKNVLINTVVLDNNDLKTLNLNNGKNNFIQYMTAKQNSINCIKIDNGFNPNPTKWFKDNSTKYCN